jgi:hypothetical protein
MADEGAPSCETWHRPHPRNGMRAARIALVLGAGPGQSAGVRGSVVAGLVLGGATGVLAWLTYYGSVDPTPVKAPRCGGLDPQPWRGGRKGVRAKKGI